MTTSKPNRLVPIEDAADVIGIHRRTLRRWVDEGIVKGYRLGPKLLRVDMDDIDRLLRPIEPTSPTKAS